MNIVITGIIIFVITFLLLSWFARQKTQKIAQGARSLIIILSLLIAIILVIGGRILFSLPLFFLALSALKIKGLTAFQIWQIWRLLNYLRATGRYSYFGQNRQASSSGNLTTDECYKVLGLQKPCSKQDVINATAQLQKKIHPDLNKNQNTEYLSKIVNNAKDTILKNDFS
ncbi:DnaJ domain-containing protein [Pelagibacteraceae bacterium]|nr:DnaJ domain-containing protein [Pelagibacteraceae bacterium]